MSEIENGRLGLYGIVQQFEELGFKGLNRWRTDQQLLTNSVADDVREKYAVGKRRWSPADSEVVGATLNNLQRSNNAWNCPQKSTIKSSYFYQLKQVL